MTQPLSARLGLFCAVACAVAGTNVAHAQEGVAMKNLLGSIGIIPPEKDPIQYRERAPLVIPPRMELRQPVSREGFASANPQWPNDPDVARRRERTASDRTPVTESEIRRMSERNPGMSQQELRRGRVASTEPGVHRSEKVDMNVPSLGLDRGTSDGSDDNAPVVRKTLAEPPTGFRQAARGTGSRVDPDFQVRTDQQAADASPMNWLTRAFRKSDDDE